MCLWVFSDYISSCRNQAGDYLMRLLGPPRPEDENHLSSDSQPWECTGTSAGLKILIPRFHPPRDSDVICPGYDLEWEFLKASWVILEVESFNHNENKYLLYRLTLKMNVTAWPIHWNFTGESCIWVLITSAGWVTSEARIPANIPQLKFTTGIRAASNWSEIGQR